MKDYKKLKERIEELEKRVELLETTGVSEEYFFFPMAETADEDYEIEFTPDPEFLDSLRNSMHQAVESARAAKLGQVAAESGGGPIKSADIVHFPGMSAEDYLRKCPHDNKRCSHDCEGLECWRELNGG